jgi:hypothetical protein
MTSAPDRQTGRCDPPAAMEAAIDGSALIAWTLLFERDKGVKGGYAAAKRSSTLDTLVPFKSLLSKRSRPSSAPQARALDQYV